MTTVNRLCLDLGIKNPLERTTCIGYGKAKPTCGNAVAAASRSAAFASLERICDAIADGTSPSRLRGDLEAVAHLLHCKRWHQYQAPVKSQEWEARLRDSIAQRNEEQQARRQRTSQPQRESRRRTRNRQASQSAVPAFDAAQYERNFLLMQSQINALQSRLDDYQRRSQRLTLTASLSASSVSSHAHVFTDEDSSEDSDSETESEDDDDDSDPEESDLEDSTARAPAESRASGSTITPIRPSWERVSPRGSSSTSSSRPSIASSASSSASSSSSSSSSGNECGICLSRLNGGRRNKWRCETCHNKVHMDCFNSWVASSPEGNVRCIYWYVLSSAHFLCYPFTTCISLLTPLPCLQSFRSQNLTYSTISFLAPRLCSVGIHFAPGVWRAVFYLACGLLG